MSNSIYSDRDDDCALNLKKSLAPGCYGMAGCYREGSEECGTCPFAATCRPLAEKQLAMLRAENIESYDDRQRREARDRQRRRRAMAAPPRRPAPTPATPAPRPSIPKALLAALVKAVANRGPTDRRLQKLVEKEADYVRFAIINWKAGDVSAREVAELYADKVGVPMTKKQAENRRKVIANLIADGIWPPFQSGAE